VHLLHPFQTHLECVLLDQYPFVDYDDLALPADVAALCFPRGGRLERPVPPNEPLPSFWVSVMVDELGRVSYVHCLVLWEPLSVSQASCIDTSVGASRTRDGSFFGPRALCLVSRWNFPAFRECLMELYRMSLSPAEVPLERVIGNLVAEVPLPPAGRLVVQHSIGAATVEFCRPPPNRRTSAEGLPMREVFECLPLPALELVLRALVTERPLVLHSSQISMLSATAEVLVSLMYPLKWQGAYVPVLPCRRRALALLDMMGFFILGMPTERWLEVATAGKTLADSLRSGPSASAASPGPFTAQPKIDTFTGFLMSFTLCSSSLTMLNKSTSNRPQVGQEIISTVL
jgi:hypothetical protein